MLLNTKHFGEIEIDEGRIISFNEGLPSFENVKQFVVLKEDDTSPFKWLQSVDHPELAFVIADPFAVKKDYNINLSEETLKTMEIEKPEDVLVYAIVVVPEDMSKISMNLKAPVIINIRNNRGMQVILDTDRYGVRHYILEELQRQEVAGNACTDKEEGSVDHHK